MFPTSLISILILSVGLATNPDTEPPVHCQVPCGIYVDMMRIDMLMEDASTIEKGMAQITALSAEAKPNFNQVVRWTMNKDSHAQSIQDMVSSYWLAQRIKAPKKSDPASRLSYLQRLELLHGITVAAMKCKQTTDASHVARLRELAKKFSSAYFSKEDLKHLKHHKSGH